MKLANYFSKVSSRKYISGNCIFISNFLKRSTQRDTFTSLSSSIYTENLQYFTILILEQCHDNITSIQCAWNLQHTLVWEWVRLSSLFVRSASWPRIEVSLLGEGLMLCQSGDLETQGVWWLWLKSGPAGMNLQITNAKCQLYTYTCILLYKLVHFKQLDLKQNLS